MLTILRYIGSWSGPEPELGRAAQCLGALPVNAIFVRGTLFTALHLDGLNARR